MDERASLKVPRLIGLTGGIASGKSTVGRLLRQLGAVVVDADEVARAVVEPGRPAYHRLIAAFGPDILQSQDPGSPSATGARPAATAPAPPAALPAPIDAALRPIDREKLAGRVFGDKEARLRLNQITHPEIAAESARRIAAAAAAGAPVIVYEVPLLVENNLQHGMNGVVVVDVPEELQLARAVQRGGLTLEQARARMAAQSPRAVRLRAANWIIDNQGDEAATAAQVAAIWPALCEGPTPPPGGGA